MSGAEMESEIGKVTLSEEVVATIAGVAATECYGVLGLSTHKVADGLAELLGRENLARGVEVHVEHDRVTVALGIVIAYGVHIPEVARNVMEKVKYSVESSTGLKVERVRVHVQGIRMVAR